MKKQIENVIGNKSEVEKKVFNEKNTQCDKCEIGFKSEYHLNNHIKSSEHLFKMSMARKFGYNLNKKATKTKLLKGAAKVPFENEVKPNCIIMNFSDGSYFYSVLPAIESWKRKYSEYKSWFTNQDPCFLGSLF